MIFSAENLTSNLDLEALAPIPVDAAPETVAQKATDIFCSKWHYAKEGLDLLLLILKNPVARWVVGIVITIGDNLQGKICGSK